MKIEKWQEGSSYPLLWIKAMAYETLFHHSVHHGMVHRQLGDIGILRQIASVVTHVA